MTLPVPVPALVQASPWPALGAPDFNDAAYAAGSTQPAAFQRNHDIAVANHTNTTVSHENMQAAVSAADKAIAAQEAVNGAVNFKGLWVDLTGALNKPATVKHNNRFWLLLRNVANVALEEPGVSTAWTSQSAGSQIQQEVASGVVNCVTGVTYVITGTNVTLNAPTTGLNQGDVFSVRLAAEPSRTQIVNFGALNVRGQAGGERYINITGFGLDLEFNTNKGWV